MCLLAICNTNKMKEDEFKEAFKCNADGAGFSWKQDDKLHYKKGLMTVKDAWEFYETLNILPHIAHFRLGSPKTPNLTHPFVCEAESPLELEGITEKPLIFHNGSLYSWKDKLFTYFMQKGKIISGDWSDTRLIACLVEFFGKEVFGYIDGKFALMTLEGIDVFGEFKDENGVLYSNTSHHIIAKTPYRGNYGYTGGIYENMMVGDFDTMYECMI